ncbi:MAG: ATP-binding cassette domain-containing protein [Clostridia bacterium]|nr:ATP-binding cassette domain-containing protein [Clostridia bacterium]
MARDNETREQMPKQSEDFAQARQRAQTQRAAQARARSIARAQAAERSRMMARARAEARMRALDAETDRPVASDVSAPNVKIPEAPPTVNPEPAPEKEIRVPVTEAMHASEAEARHPDELEYAIQIRDLYKSYGKKEVLKGLSLDVYPGELFGFIGRNGIGKSTTIDCMIGAKRFNSGEIVVGGYNIRREPIEAKCSYGYVASEPTCYEVMTGYDYLEFVASIYHLTETEFQGNYQYLCSRLQLNLQDLAHNISGYSHGMKQKLCLAASLLHNPNIWILDEPTVGLDIMAQEELKKMMREYANHGKTVFLTSHNIELVSAICDRVAIINDGVVKVVYDLNKNPEKRAALPRLFLDLYGG